VNVLELLAASFGHLHEALGADIAEVSEDDLWWQPAEGLNHAGFLFWHIVRDEDDVTSHVSRERQLWVTERWHERLGMDANEQGTGLASERLETFRYDRAMFMEYAASVWARTGPLIQGLDEGALVRPAWPGSDWDTARLLVEGCLGHGWEHLGEIRSLKGLRGWRFRE
jgi:hypothetical protein